MHTRQYQSHLGTPRQEGGSAATIGAYYTARFFFVGQLRAIHDRSLYGSTVAHERTGSALRLLGDY